jgi:hypothetical protein
LNTPKRQQVESVHLIVDVTIEPGTESVERTVGYVVQALKASQRNIRDGSVVIAIKRDGQLIGVDLSGTPSENLQDQVDNLMDALDTSNITV